MNIGIIGLGLIGGSIAKALSEKTPHRLYLHDTDAKTLREAKKLKNFAHLFTAETAKECDVIFICLYPKDVIRCFTESAFDLKTGAVVLDCGGVKTEICELLFPIARELNFTFIGGHPMAGTHAWGYSAARAELFDGASMLLCPDKKNPNTKKAVAAAEKLCAEIGFGKCVKTTPREHDEIIAYTSQLPHVISACYIKSPEALKHRGFSAGSYKDMSRVAMLNENMWAELFLENAELLGAELDVFIGEITKMRDAVKTGDKQRLLKMLGD